MNPNAVLLEVIRPMILSAVARGAVRPIGEDLADVEQDCVLQAAKILDSATRRGKAVQPESVVFYTLQSVKSGRRSGSHGRCDVMGTACQLDGNSTVMSIDAGIGDDEDGADDQPTLHDVLASSVEDPDVSAARNLDWCLVEPLLDARETMVLRDTADGVPGLSQAELHGVSPARVTQLKRQVGAKVMAAWGGNPSVDAGREPAWRRHVATFEARRACRHRRKTA